MPGWFCIKLGLWVDPVVVGTRTRPPLSGMMMARMNCLSTPDAFVAALISAQILFVSS
jgi:hypothetical protein